jgi:hypothetical protein
VSVLQTMMSVYESDLEKKAAPTLKQLVWALSWMHEEELREDLLNAPKNAPRTPDAVRTYHYSRLTSIPVVRLHNCDSGYEMSLSPLQAELIETLHEPFMLWDNDNTDREGCCYSGYERYVSVSVVDDELITKMAKVTFRGCDDYGGGRWYKKVIPVNCTVTFREILERYPRLIGDILRKSNVDTIIDNL